MLIGGGSPLQELGPFLFHGGEGISRDPTEAGCTIGLPQVSIGVGGSAAMLEMPAEAGGSTAAPQE